MPRPPTLLMFLVYGELSKIRMMMQKVSKNELVEV